MTGKEYNTVWHQATVTRTRRETQNNHKSVNLFLQAGIIALTAFISPLKLDRERVRAIIGTGNFLEIHCACPLEICEQRDVKGLYKKARAGIIKNYTGISSPYEAPENPALRLDSGTTPLEECVEQIITLLKDKRILSL